MIDYCITLFDERERVLFPLHINSLRHHMPGVFNIKVSVRPEDAGGIALCENFGVEALPHPIYTQSPGKSAGLYLSSFDLANRLDLLMRACTSDWVMLSHMDIVWVGNMMLRVQPLMTDEYGLLGCYPHGSIAVNRKAYGECHGGFWHYSFEGQYFEGGVPRVCDRRPWVRLMGMNDPQLSNPDGVRVVIPAIDVGVMLEIEMQTYAYKHDRLGVADYHHIGAGSYHSRGGVADFYKELPMTEEIRDNHKMIADNVQRALIDYAMFK